MLIRALQVLGIKDKSGSSPIWPGAVAEINDEIGQRLVKDGAAEEVGMKRSDLPSVADSADGEGIPSDDGQDGLSGQENVNQDTANDYLESMSYNELKAYAKELGIDAGKIRSKAGMIDAIEHVLNADDDLPDLSVQDVVD